MPFPRSRRARRIRLSGSRRYGSALVAGYRGKRGRARPHGPSGGATRRAGGGGRRCCGGGESRLLRGVIADPCGRNNRGGGLTGLAPSFSGEPDPAIIVARFVR